MLEMLQMLEILKMMPNIPIYTSAFPRHVIPLQLDFLFAAKLDS